MSRSLPTESGKSRILFVSPAAHLGGAERCLLDFVWAVRALPDPPRVRVLSLAQGPLVAELEALGSEVRVLPLPAPLANLGEAGLGRASGTLRLLLGAAASTAFLARLAREVRTFSPHVLHTNGMKAHLLAGALASRGARHVVHLHDFASSRRLATAVLPWLARRGTRFVANSRAVAQDFRALAPHGDVKVVYNAIDTDRFCPGAFEPDWLAQRAGLAPSGDSCVSFGLVATYAKWKGHHLFIEAAQRLLAGHPHASARFYVIGGPIYATGGSQVSAGELLDHIERLGLRGRVGLIPFQLDVARVYRALNVLVHASTAPEPFGRTIVEAMASERPVLVARTGGARELFQDGETALGFESGDASELAAKMAEVLTSADLRRRLGARAREHAVESFSRTRLPGQLAGAFGWSSGTS